MRRTLLGLLAAVLIASGSTLVATPAQAATKPVTITKLSTQWIGWNGTAVVKPKLKKATGVKVTRRSLVVRQGGQVVRTNANAVRLKVGTYQLTTKVTYRLKGKKRTVSAKQRLIVKQGRCVTNADYRSVTVNETAGAGDAARTVARKLRNSGELMSDVTGDMTLGDWRDEMVAEDPDAAAAFDELIAVYGEDALMDVSVHAVCQDRRKMVAVLYIDGHAIDKSVDSWA